MLTLQNRGKQQKYSLSCWCFSFLFHGSLPVQKLQRRYYQGVKAGLQSPISDSAGKLLNKCRKRRMNSATGLLLPSSLAGGRANLGSQIMRKTPNTPTLYQEEKPQHLPFGRLEPICKNQAGQSTYFPTLFVSYYVLIVYCCAFPLPGNKGGWRKSFIY